MNNGVKYIVVDYVVVGGGIAGLYAAWKLRQREPLATIALLEGSPSLGGRARTRYFAGMDLPTGAGVGRSRDVKLKALVRDLGLGGPNKSIQEHPRHVHLQAELAPLRNRWQTLWRRVVRHAHKYEEYTFEDALYAILNDEDAQLFILLSGYTDYLQANVMDVVNWYGMQDNAPLTSISGDRIFYVSWGKLVEELADRVGRDNIYTRHVVTRVKGGRVECKDLSSPRRRVVVWQARKHIYVGIPAPQLKYMFRYHEPLKVLGHQPFIRVYAVLDKPIQGLHGYTVVCNELQKVIPMSEDGRVVMIAYADNDMARLCWKAAAQDNTKWFEKRLNMAFHLEGRAKVKIVRMWHKYWYIGTHFFTRGDVSLAELQRVSHRISLIGEAVSHKQGWVEGALESVDAVLGKRNTNLAMALRNSL